MQISTNLTSPAPSGASPRGRARAAVPSPPFQAVVRCVQGPDRRAPGPGPAPPPASRVPVPRGKYGKAVGTAGRPAWRARSGAARTERRNARSLRPPWSDAATRWGRRRTRAPCPARLPECFRPGPTSWMVRTATPSGDAPHLPSRTARRGSACDPAPRRTPGRPPSGGPDGPHDRRRARRRLPAASPGSASVSPGLPEAGRAGTASPEPPTVSGCAGSSVAGMGHTGTSCSRSGAPSQHTSTGMWQAAQRISPCTITRRSG